MSTNSNFRDSFQSFVSFLSKQLCGLGKFNKKALHANHSSAEQFYTLCSNGLSSSSERIKNGLPPDEARKEREFQTALYKMAYQRSRDDQTLILKLSARHIFLIVFCIVFLGAIYIGNQLKDFPEAAFSSTAVSDIDKAEKMCYSGPYDSNAGTPSPQNLP